MQRHAIKYANWILAAVSAIALLANLPPGARATAESGTLSVWEQGYSEIKFEFNSTTAVKYTIVLTSGPRVDVFLFDKDEYRNYATDENFHYIEAGTSLNVSMAQKNITLNAGTYYLLVDNTDYGVARPPANGVVDIATVNYTVEHSPSADANAGPLPGWLYPAAGIAVIVAVIAAVAYAVKKR